MQLGSIMAQKGKVARIRLNRDGAFKEFWQTKTCFKKALIFNPTLTNLGKEPKPMQKPAIKCECGVQIPFNHDPDAMQQAIEEHAETHRHTAKDCSKTDAANQGEAQLEVDRIKSDLMRKTKKC
jgi:hypothetical protein